MGCGTFTTSAYHTYATSVGATYNVSTGRLSGQTFKSNRIDESLNPRNFNVRECVNNDEHPNTIPVILALDVTGSMGSACKETAATLGIIITNLYEKFKDIEFCVMGIGDLAYDSAPIQMSQFESDVRIAEALDKIYMEYGGGGNGYESYSAAWYMGLKRTKLDCFDKQGRKGIIITMGDEPLNPYLPEFQLSNSIGGFVESSDIDTKKLYNEAIEKFDIYHIAVDHPDTSYRHYKQDIEKTFGQLLGSKLKISSIDNLSNTIENCITESIQSNGVMLLDSVQTEEETNINSTIINENGEISW